MTNTDVGDEMGFRVLVVEDVPELLEDLAFCLQQAGYSVSCAANSQQFWEAFAQQRPDIVLLDVGLPGESGLQIAQRVRAAHAQIGIVMLTGRSLLADRLGGRSAGADDYLIKPVQMDELLLVLRNLVRRLGLEQPKCWVIDTQALQLSAPSGAHMALTRSEWRVLKTWAEQPDQKASRQCLVQSLGCDWDTYDERRLEAIISRLKKKLVESFQVDQSPIRSLRGEGYAFTQPLRFA